MARHLETGVVLGEPWVCLGERGRRERFGARRGESLFSRGRELQEGAIPDTNMSRPFGYHQGDLQYDASPKGPIMNFEQIQPSLSKKVEVLFEVPTASIGKPLTLIIQQDSGLGQMCVAEKVHLPAISTGTVEDN
jgi:hypothetical protein